jgi:hypothetical protein
LACLLLLPLAASAQSSIVGLVRDESGGVLPGVTVEAASPVLIEKVRINVTDEQGRYRLVDLRPGTYRMTFSLTGFSTVVREAVELPGDFTATVNVDLKVGSLEETVTVSGETPIVDVQQAARTQLVTRDLMDTLPTTRNVMSIASLVPGVRMVTPDIGGSRQMEQPLPRMHGSTTGRTLSLSTASRSGQRRQHESELLRRQPGGGNQFDDGGDSGGHLGGGLRIASSRRTAATS